MNFQLKYGAYESMCLSINLGTFVYMCSKIGMILSAGFDAIRRLNRAIDG